MQNYCGKQKTSDKNFKCVGLWTQLEGKVKAGRVDFGRIAEGIGINSQALPQMLIYGSHAFVDPVKLDFERICCHVCTLYPCQGRGSDLEGNCFVLCRDLLFCGSRSVDHVDGTKGMNILSWGLSILLHT